MSRAAHSPDLREPPAANRTTRLPSPAACEGDAEPEDRENPAGPLDLAPADGDPVREVAIPIRPPPHPAVLRGTLRWPECPRAAVAFANGGGSGRNSPGDRYVSAELTRSGFATLLLDLLTEEEGEGGGAVDAGHLADRVEGALGWLSAEPVLAGLPVGLFGSGSGAAAALTVAARRPGSVFAVVSRDGWPDLAWDDLPAVTAPTLLVVGGEDGPGLTRNRQALDRLPGPKRLAVVPGLSYRLGEPAALHRVAALTRHWFDRHLPAPDAGRRPFERNGRG